MEQNRAMGNEVTDRARVQDRFCSQNTYTSPHTSEFAPLYFLKLKVNCPKSLQLLYIHIKCCIVVEFCLQSGHFCL